MDKYKKAILRCKNHRLEILKLSQKVQALHIGGSFSSVEIVDCIYNMIMNKQDKQDLELILYRLQEQDKSVGKLEKHFNSKFNEILSTRQHLF